MYVFTLGVMLCIAGCATVHQQCDYTDEGWLESYRLRTTVWGTGDVEVTTADCAVLAYSSSDTGLSANGTKAVGIVAEAARKTTPSGAAGSALESLIADDVQDCEDDHCD